MSSLCSRIHCESLTSWSEFDAGLFRPDLGKLGGVGLCRELNFYRLRERERPGTERQAGAYQRRHNSP